jgi:hypothetical protein
MIRLGESEDRGVFADRDGLWRPKIGASVGVVERVPLPWIDRFFLRWLPHLALRRAQALAALRRLEAPHEQHPSGVTVRNWDHET